MKVLLIGLGSAGQRHMRNLRRIRGEEVEFIAYRVRKLERVFDDNLNIIEGQRISEMYHVREFDNLEKALKEKPDIAVISNPNSMHIDCAIEVAKHGIDIFLEKPVSNGMEGVDELRQIIEEKKIILYVGFQMRMHPCIIRLKQDIENGVIGKIVSVDCHMGELLTEMHKYEDYRVMNESQAVMGGGVVLCQIHEIDYLYWIFGMPQEIYAVGKKYSNLEIDVEDAVSSVWRYGNEQGYSITLHQDFLQTPPVRKCRIIGTDGQIEVDLLSNKYSLLKKGAVKEEIFHDFVRNDMFIKELETFLSYVETRDSQMLSLKDGVGSLRIALAIKKSMNEKGVVRL